MIVQPRYLVQSSANMDSDRILLMTRKVAEAKETPGLPKNKCNK